MSEKEKSAGRSGHDDSWFKELLKTILYALVIAMGIRTFLFEPFNIPSASMVPTLLVGDYIFVSKYSYGYSKHSFPWSLGPFEGRIWESPVERGDVVVFKEPCRNETDFIKRIVGVPGDRIEMIRGVLYINSQPVKREFLGPITYINKGVNHRGARLYRETMPGGKNYYTLDSTRTVTDVVVPEGHYFAMGDNRDNSSDSRVSCQAGGIGLIPAENIVGKAEVIFFSTNKRAAFWEVWKWPKSIRFDRIFDDITELDDSYTQQ